MGLVFVRPLTAEELERCKSYLDDQARAGVLAAEQARERRRSRMSGRRRGKRRTDGPLCACGCGVAVVTPHARWLRGHNVRVSPVRRRS